MCFSVLFVCALHKTTGNYCRTGRLAYVVSPYAYILLFDHIYRERIRVALFDRRYACIAYLFQPSSCTIDGYGSYLCVRVKVAATTTTTTSVYMYYDTLPNNRARNYRPLPSSARSTNVIIKKKTRDNRRKILIYTV